MITTLERGGGGQEMKHGEWRSDNSHVKQKCLGSVSTTLVAAYSSKAERQLKSIQNFTCALHEVNCSKCNKADLKCNNKHQY